MTRLRIFLARLAEQLRGDRIAADFDDELRAHFEHLVDDNRRRGMSDAEALRQAHLALGGVTQTREAVGDRRGLPALGSLWSTFRHSVRLLARTPGVTAAAVVALALGIGANTAVFSVVDAALLRPLPYHAPDRLVAVWEVASPTRDRLPLSPKSAIAYRRASGVERLGIYTSSSLTLTGRGDPVRVSGEQVSASYFETLGVAPRYGRPLLLDDETTGRDNVVVISHALWRERLGGRDDAVGETLIFDGRPYQIVGVMPADFVGISALSGQTPVDFWRPAVFPPDMLVGYGEHVVKGIARLAPGRTIAAVHDELRGIAVGFDLPPTAGAMEVGMNWLHDDIAQPSRALLLWLFAAVALILLLSCLNVAGLLVVRTMARRREIAVRVALGASRARIVTELAMPSLLLAALGALAGWALAVVVQDALVRLAPATIPRLASAALDTRVLAFTAIVSVVAAVAFTLLPAWPLLRTRPSEALASTSRVVAHTWALRSRAALVCAEVAISALLLVGAGLMVRSVASLNGVPLGFRSDQVLTTSISLPSSRYPNQPARLAFFDALAERLTHTPGAESVAFANRLPLRGDWSSGFLFVSAGPELASLEAGLTAGFQSVNPGYFTTLDIPLVRGRALDDRDRDGAMAVAVVNEAFGATIMRGRDPIGQQIQRFPGAPAITIVGVVADVRRLGPREPVRPEVYLPARQTSLYPLPLSEVAVRVSGDPMAFAPTIRAMVTALDPSQPTGTFRTLDQTRALGQAEPRFQLFLLSLFAVLALTLAIVGIYSVVAYTVGQRTGEIGLRLALGASRGAILGWLVAASLRVSLTGAAIGLGAGVLVARTLRRFLFETSPADALTLGAVAAILIVAALLASLTAARRALSIDPAIALQS